MLGNVFNKVSDAATRAGNWLSDLVHGGPEGKAWKSLQNERERQIELGNDPDKSPQCRALEARFENIRAEHRRGHDLAHK